MGLKQRIEKLEKHLKPGRSVIFIVQLLQRDLSEEEEQLIKLEKDRLERKGGTQFITLTEETLNKLRERHDQKKWERRTI